LEIAATANRIQEGPTTAFRAQGGLFVCIIRYYHTQELYAAGSCCDSIVKSEASTQQMAHLTAFNWKQLKPVWRYQKIGAVDVIKLAVAVTLLLQ
jgi:hypothetical protein